MPEEYGTHLDVIQRGLVTAVPYVVAAVVMVPWARHSDRTGERVWHVAVPAIAGGIAIPAALYMQNVYLAMLAVTVCTCAVMCALPVFWSLPSAFLTGAAAAGGIALINSLGQHQRLQRPLRHRLAHRPDRGQPDRDVGGGHAVAGGRGGGGAAGRQAAAVAVRAQARQAESKNANSSRIARRYAERIAGLSSPSRSSRFSSTAATSSNSGSA